jgi:hypothetical protein
LQNVEMESSTLSMERTVMTETLLMEMDATHVVTRSVVTVELILVRNAMPAWVIPMS